MKWNVCILLFALAAAPSYAASLGDAAKVVSGDDSNDHRAGGSNSRRERSLPGGPVGAVDSMNNVDPWGPVDAIFNEVFPKDSSEEKLDPGAPAPPMDLGTVEEKVAELQEQIAGVVPEPAKPAEPKPAPNPAEAAAEAQEQQPQQEQQQQQADPGVSAQEKAAEAAEQAAPTGPDNSNKEDGDGNGNNNGQQEQQNGNGGQQEQQNAQHDSGSGGPDLPPQQEWGNGHPGNSVDWGNEDTKS